jgi:hypothetical protein
MTPLGTLERVDLRQVWGHEAYHFTPWLSQEENLAALGNVLDLELELAGTEVSVGPYAADILCKDALTGDGVLIENQLAKTDHNHLGQILTYAAGLETKTVIWVASKFTDEHRAAIDWLNEITRDDWQFFGLEIELWRIGTSAPAPKFNVICRPNDWSRAVRDEAAKAEGNSPTQALQLKFWTAYRDRMAEKGLKAPKPSAQSWQSFRVGRTGFSLEAVVRRTEQTVAVRLYINCDDLPPKAVFHYLLARQTDIHHALGFDLSWNELPDKKGSVLYLTRAACPLEDEDRWPEYQDWMAATIAKMVAVFQPLIKPLQLSDLPVIEAIPPEHGATAADLSDEGVGFQISP